MLSTVFWFLIIRSTNGQLHTYTRSTMSILMMIQENSKTLCFGIVRSLLSLAFVVACLLAMMSIDDEIDRYSFMKMLLNLFQFYAEPNDMLPDASVVLPRLTFNSHYMDDQSYTFGRLYTFTGTFNKTVAT